jgi:hypothetical protein
VASEVADDHRDDDGARGSEDDTQDYHPHASRGQGDKVCVALAFSILLLEDADHYADQTMKST